MGEVSTGTKLFADPAHGRGLFIDGLVVLRRGTIAVLLVLAILYGSLIPFRFDPGRLTVSHLAGSLLQFRDTTPEDVAVNVFAYAVLAAGLFCLSRRKCAMEAVGTVVLCSALSLAVEMLQALIPQRVSSATDCLLNGFGATLGAIACALLLACKEKFVHAAVREFRERPLGLCVIAISSALLAYHLVPFDFITNTEQLHASFRRIQLFGFPSGLAAITDELCGAAWFAVLGFLIAKDARGQGRSHVQSLRASLQHGLILACLIECLQLFTRSHVPELATAIIRVMGAFFGAWTAAFLAGHPPVRSDAVRRRPISTSLLFAAAAIQFLFLGLSLFPRLHGSPTAFISSGWSLPFQSLWLQPASLAGARSLSVIVPACLLAGTLAAAFRRAGVPFFRVVSSLIVIGFYFGMQFLSATLASKPIDFTNALLAVLACGFALRMERWLARFDDMTPEGS